MGPLRSISVTVGVRSMNTVEIADRSLGGIFDFTKVLSDSFLVLETGPSDALTLRSGLVLPPVGIINETHEPPTFNGVDRPGFDNDVIPTTWREIGVGAVGRVPGVEGLSYRVYLVNGLRSAGFSATSALVS